MAETVDLRQNDTELVESMLNDLYLADTENDAK